MQLLTTDEMARADKLAVAAGVPSLTLMENAGRAVADEAANMVPAGARVAVLCGPGNNGGDGFVAARLLSETGFAVQVGLLGSREALKGDAAAMAARWQGGVAAPEHIDLGATDLIVDALFGAGLTRPLEGVAAALVGRINASRRPILAVDVPSGLDGTTGASVGPVVQATRTVTFFRKKPGHLLLPGRTLCNETVVADIGIPASVLADIGPRTIENGPGAWRAQFPRLAIDGHKYSRGHAVVVSGPAFHTGAARLGARGALRIGAGLVTVASPAGALLENAAHLTAIMLRPCADGRALSEMLSDMRKNAVLVGPGAGVGSETRAYVEAALASAAHVVLDADALTSFAELDGSAREAPRWGFGFTSGKEQAPGTLDALFAAVKARSAAVVLTPHEGEFKRLFANATGSKVDRARAAAARSGSVVLLKGPDTVIADPDGRAAINANAPPWLATAGSGDVLAGFVTGLLAQGMPAFEATCAAVWLHGECASYFGRGLIAEDLPEILPEVLEDVSEGG